MKTHKNLRLKKELLIVEFPEGVKIFQDEDDEGNHIGYSLTKFEKDSIQSFGLVEGYTLLGKPDEIKEEDARELVGTEEYVWNNQICAAYVFHGKSKKCYTESAVKSLLSAIETVVQWENPHGKEEPNKSYFLDDKGSFLRQEKKQWHKAQEKTFDRNRTLIFVEN